MILDGKKLAQKIYDELKIKIEKLNKKPTLVAILVGNNPASLTYIKQKRKFAEYVGMNFELIHYEGNIEEEIVLAKIEELNNNSNISGYIVQLPLSEHIDSQKIIDRIDPKKDVDGFTKENIGKLFLKEENGLLSCTPKGIKRLLDEYNINLKGKNVTIIGKSNIVGKPLSLLFINHSATVTVCDIFTQDISEHTLKSDIVISAAGVPHLIKENMIKKGTILIDVGYNIVDGKMVGDIDFPNLEKDNYITPVPGGVGPLTVAMLIENTYLAHIQVGNE
ncbi:MAG: bifunctional 5,10-methylenetetrahydrofolate dehydrogenase/5,10-methenyltetrahydrofolate cyclohydrolase [Candidatus Gracilibacteria bacterium]|nr:bifunctional 5,10-methylenetetrahydrofolate dehydrogenase/5,10-methenyltetrahydrofolate cyclohydrolase [Candidatus Gracilibacteria bacterium]MDD2909245.1 bifunctional 5,10-methylenetetrahydrofolate dehydrogenase/5,10-methenyltetrahydrofolate cyclohydrolase [Candidatus Gracilibacteria bacterium]